MWHGQYDAYNNGALSRDRQAGDRKERIQVRRLNRQRPRDV